MRLSELSNLSEGPQDLIGSIAFLFLFLNGQGIGVQDSSNHTPPGSMIRPFVTRM